MILASGSRPTSAGRDEERAGVLVPKEQPVIIDLDAHLREEYFLDEVYKLDGPFANLTPERIGDGKYQHARFRHQLSLEDTAFSCSGRRGRTRTATMTMRM